MKCHLEDQASFFSTRLLVEKAVTLNLPAFSISEVADSLLSTAAFLAWTSTTPVSPSV
jgi:hypothetical protein